MRRVSAMLGHLQFNLVARILAAYAPPRAANTVGVIAQTQSEPDEDQQPESKLKNKSNKATKAATNAMACSLLVITGLFEGHIFLLSLPGIFPFCPSRSFALGIVVVCGVLLNGFLSPCLGVCPSLF